MQSSGQNSLNSTPQRPAAASRLDQPMELVRPEIDPAQIKSLSKNAIRDICDPEKKGENRGKQFIVQATDVKVFSAEDQKKNIRQR